jgi:hypothetical protein
MNRTMWFALFLIVSVLQATAHSISTNGTGINQPANAWLGTPTPSPLTADTVSQPVRLARDQYVDTIFGSASALTTTTASLAHIARDNAVPDLTKLPEMPRNPDRAVLTGTFMKFQSLLSQSQRSLYTEVSFSIDRVFADPTSQLAPAAAVTLIVPGGSVQTSRDSLSYLVDPEQFFIQPQKRYLLVLSYHSDGDFFTLAKSWELSSGVVKPNSRLEQLRAANRTAALAGASETQLDSLLQPLLSITY